MPAFSNARLSGPAVAVKGSLRRASPALDRAHRTLLSSPNPLEFQKRLHIRGVIENSIETVTGNVVIYTCMFAKWVYATAVLSVRILIV